MKFTALSIQGAYLIEHEVWQDERGTFARTFCKEEFLKRNLEINFVQNSRSLNLRRGVIRGLHYQQNENLETKLVECVRGEIFDVILDLRKNSPSFGVWCGINLSVDSHKMLYIPEGCAHGFQAIKDTSEVYYHISKSFIASAQAGYNCFSAELNITWPVDNIIISDRDRNLPMFTRRGIA